MTNKKSIKKEIKRANDYITVTAYMNQVQINFDDNKYNCQKSFVSYILMCRIWVLMELVACLPFYYRRMVLKKVKHNKLYPMKCPVSYNISKEDTLRWAYGKTSTEKWLNCHSNTRIGFSLMCFYYAPIRLKTMFKRLLQEKEID